MKRAIVILWAGVMAVNAWAASEIVDGVTWNYTVSNGKASVYKGSSSPAIPTLTKGALTIPATLGGCPVTSIGAYAFYNCSGLTSVTIPSSVTSIGERAFYDCSGLTSVTIPSSVTSIGEFAFRGCSGLMSVTIPSSVTNIGGGAFYNCSGLMSVTIPSSVSSFGCSRIHTGLSSTEVGVFSECTALMFVLLNDGLRIIGNRMFSGCSKLTSVTIPSSVTSIGDYAFYGCCGLTSVTIPSSVTSIGYSAFYGCSGLMRVNITNLEKWCGLSFGDSYANPLYYAHCLYLNGEEVKDLTIPEGVTSIGYSAFYGCTGLTSVTIPEGVTSIGSSAFYGCSGLTSVTIPEGVTNIGERAFYGCSGLTSVTIPEGVTNIGSSAFYGCSGLTSVTIPEGVTSIGYSAFSGCSGLTSVTIPSSVTSIGERAFNNCSGLTSVTIPSSVTSIGDYAFYNCSGLTSVEFRGPPLSDVSCSYLLNYGSRLVFPREYGAQWMAISGINSFAGYGQGEKPEVEILSAAIRENDPTVMDVVYKVKSPRPTVKVRALVFQDGERSFAKVVRPTEFIEDTAKNIGNAITANKEHKLSWRVSADWKIDLAKMKFEVLASDGDLLPLELTTIPKIGGHAAMEISWNAITSQQVLDALLWLYADGDEGLTVVDGKLKNGTTQLANAASLSTTAAIAYVYSKMGFSVLSGDNLKYANEMTRLGLSPSGVRQYAWREVND